VPLKTYALAERPDLEDEFERFAALGWPRFLRQRDALGAGALWPSLFRTFAGFQLLVCEGERVVAVGHTAPIAWDGTAGGLPDSIAGILENATARSALVAITGDHRGRGLGTEVLRAMHALAAGTASARWRRPCARR